MGGSFLFIPFSFACYEDISFCFFGDLEDIQLITEKVKRLERQFAAKPLVVVTEMEPDGDASSKVSHGFDEKSSVQDRRLVI
ncbi:hypothetical protein EJ110_NYTH35588 [Nymphaea thermarum]|nr:hypothetical protein EJ110_NYTH35588 [Nymphaea thermarum]